eukprot:TRINITY_DN9711_c0_g1_i1.p1 TRINITY_DN9711_c0_g1~~TRINITY_DN9711_c0_g1_i1.p1  ORF type:complete len:166 (-),score=35.98 TRINITY_DN9711_c0_g1_i1:58-555(-)
MLFLFFFFFFSSRRRHTRCREVSWARRCVQETGTWDITMVIQMRNQMSKQLSLCFRVFHLLIIFRNPLYRMPIEEWPARNQQNYNYDCACNVDLHRDLKVLKNKTNDKTDYCNNGKGPSAVSYTHLTLPTILLVQISVVAVSLKKKKKKTNTNTNVYNRIRYRQV